MQQISWKCLAVISIAMCSLVMAVPVPQNEETSFQNPSLDPANQGLIADLTPDDRGKRGFGPDVGFGVKNAVLGYVFGKIDGILDAKTKLLNQFDQTNIEKNKAAGIEPPAPISSLQQLLSAVIQPKIAAITSKFGALSGSSAGGLGSLSGGSSGGLGGLSGGAPVPSPDNDDDVNADLNDDDTGAPVASAGSGNIISSFLKLSGPILSSSSAGAKGGVPSPIDDSDE